jgi:hypothetical protein
MKWTFNNTTFDSIPENETAIGFVYIVTNTVTGKQYIGKKSFYSTQSKIRTVTLKTTGVKKKKKIKVTKESDWRDYYGSSDEVQKDIGLYTKDNFTRQILKLCYSKGEMSYFEAKFQFDYDVLLNPDKWYNGWISVKVHRTHLKTVDKLN